MSIRVGVLCFSPTKTTRSICEAIAAGMGTDELRMVDITLPEERMSFRARSESLLADIDHLVVGAPVYAGKLPPLAIEAFGALRGNGTKCTAVVAYGNRDYGVALRRLVEILSGLGYKVVSCGAFIGQHSYFEVVPVAIGRPDAADLSAARSWGETIVGLSKGLLVDEVPVQIDIIAKSKKYFPTKPTHISANCVRCGICAEHCTAGVISPETGEYVAKRDCIGCTACVRVCPNAARVIKPNPIMKAALRKILGEASRTRREPVTVVAGA